MQDIILYTPAKFDAKWLKNKLQSNLKRSFGFKNVFYEVSGITKKSSNPGDFFLEVDNYFSYGKKIKSHKWPQPIRLLISSFQKCIHFL